MYLTPEQEEFYVRKYDRLVWSVVHHFRNRNAFQDSDNRDDLYQECMYVLVLSLRKAPTMEGYRPPILDMINAMCRFTLLQLAASYPKRTSDYKKRISETRCPMDMDALESVAGDSDKGFDETELAMVFRNFMESLTPRERLYVRLKLLGSTNRDIGRRFGVSDVGMTRQMARIHQKYNQCAAV